MTKKQQKQIELLEKMAREKGILIWQRDIKRENVEFIKYLTSSEPKPLNYQASAKDYTWLHCFK